MRELSPRRRLPAKWGFFVSSVLLKIDKSMDLDLLICCFALEPGWIVLIFHLFLLQNISLPIEKKLIV